MAEQPPEEKQSPENQLPENGERKTQIRTIKPGPEINDSLKMVNSFIPPPITDTERRLVERYGEGLKFYSKFPPPESWTITRSLGNALEVKYATEEAQQLWNNTIGNLWTIPPDGRIELTFQQHILERLEKDEAIPLLEGLRQVLEKLEYGNAGGTVKRGSFRVTDYDFDLDFKSSVAEYGGDISVGKFMEPFEDSPYRRQLRSDIKERSRYRQSTVKWLDEIKIAPWKRIM